MRARETSMVREHRLHNLWNALSTDESRSFGEKWIHNMSAVFNAYLRHSPELRTVEPLLSAGRHRT